MDNIKAEQLSELEKELMRKFKEAQEEESRRIEQIGRENKEEIKPEAPKLLFDSKPTSTITVEEARKIENIEKRLRNEFATYQHREGEKQRQREKQYEPITKVLKEAKLQETTKEIVTFKPMITSTPARQTLWAGEEETEDEPVLSWGEDPHSSEGTFFDTTITIDTRKTIVQDE